MFQVCFWANPSRDLVFKILKKNQNFDYKQILRHRLLCTQNRHLNTDSTHCARGDFVGRKPSPPPPTVCWIGVKVAVLCARQYMPSNLLIIKVLNNFLYFKHQILTGICSEAYLKHYWRNCLQKLQFFIFFQRQFLQ